MTYSTQDMSWNARGHVRAGLLCVAVLVGGIGGWALAAKLQGAVIADGQLRVETRRQVVQHPEGGVVGAILVREGGRVAGGDVLVRLDGTSLDSEIALLESQLFELMARRGRLVAEQNDRDNLDFDPELAAAAESNPNVKPLMEGQRDLFEARRKTLARGVEIVLERKDQIRKQIVGAEAEIEALEQQITLIGRELKDQQSLFSQGLAQASRVLALKRETARLHGKRGQLVAEVAKLRGQSAELDTERLRLLASHREEAITTLRDLGFRELELRQRRIALRERRARLDIRAPLGGVVLDMSVHALKSVIRPAEPILYIVPSESALVVDARIAPVNVDVVHVGQTAVLRFSAFNVRTTPEVFGVISKLSPDAMVDKITQQSIYRAEVTMKEGERAKLEGRSLIAGMPVEVYIQTGVRTPVSYLLKPITDYFNRAMREE